LLDVWHGMDHSVIDDAVGEWCKRVQAYVQAKGRDFEQLL